VREFGISDFGIGILSILDPGLSEIIEPAL